MASDARVANASSRSQVRRAAQKDKEQRRKELETLRAVLDSEAGEQLLWRLLQHGGMFANVFSTDALTMAFQAGTQNEARWLASEIEQADPEAMFRMMRNARKRQLSEAAENAAANTAPEDEDDNA